LAAAGFDRVPVLMTSSGSGHSTLKDCLVDTSIQWNADDIVPAWAVDATAVEVRLKRQRTGQPAHLLLFCGPALKQTWLAARDTLLLYLVTPVLGFGFSTCHTSLLADLPRWMLPLLMLGILPLLWHEHCVRRYLLVPITRLLRGDSPKVLGMRVGFMTWLIFTTAASATSHLDLVTNGLFAVRTLRQQFCYSHASALWLWMARKSVMPGLHLVPFGAITSLGWLLMAFQVVYGFRNSWPLTGKDLSGEKPLEYHLLQGEDEDNQCYPTRTDERATHGKALLPLLECCRMASLLNLFKEGCAKQALSNAQGRYQVPDIFGASLHNLLHRFITFCICENAFQLNLQAAGLGLARALDEHKALDHLTFLSIVTSIVMGLSDVMNQTARATDLKNHVIGIDILEELRKHLNQDCPDFKGKPEKVTALFEAFKHGSWQDKKVWEEVNRMPVVTEYKINLCEYRGSYTCVRRGLEQQQTVQRTYYCFLLVVLLWALLASRAAFQTLMVVLCPTGLHDFGVGCLALPRNSSNGIIAANAAWL